MFALLITITITADHRMAGERKYSVSFIYNLDSRQALVSVPIDSLFILFGSPVTETCHSMCSSKPPQNVTYTILKCACAHIAVIYGTEM